MTRREENIMLFFEIPIIWGTYTAALAYGWWDLWRPR